MHTKALIAYYISHSLAKQHDLPSIHLYALEDMFELWADEGAASVRRVTVEPEALALTDQTELTEAVERTDGRRTQRRTDLDHDRCDSEIHIACRVYDTHRVAQT